MCIRDRSLSFSAAVKIKAKLVAKDSITHAFRPLISPSLHAVNNAKVNNVARKIHVAWCAPGIDPTHLRNDLDRKRKYVAATPRESTSPKVNVCGNIDNPVNAMNPHTPPFLHAHTPIHVIASMFAGALGPPLDKDEFTPSMSYVSGARQNAYAAQSNIDIDVKL